MGIVRVNLGDNLASPMGSPPRGGVISSRERYFSDFLTYLSALVGLASLIELYNQPGIYRPDDTVRIICRQDDYQWFWHPSPTMETLVQNIWPEVLHLQRLPRAGARPNEDLHLGSLKKLMHSFGQALVANYFERYKRHFEASDGRFDEDKAPPVWNFARVVRNAMSHGGVLTLKPRSRAVSWKGLHYSGAQAGRSILHTDIYPGDLFDLLRDMDSALPECA